MGWRTQFRSTGNAYADAVLKRMQAQPPDDVRAAMAVFCSESQSILDKLDLFYLFAMPTQQSALLNWPNAAYDGTAIGTMDFVANLGYDGDGTGGTTGLDGPQAYIETNFLPGAGSNYQTNSACVGGVYDSFTKTTQLPTTKTRQVLEYIGSTSITSLQLKVANNGSGYRVNMTATRVFTYGNAPDDTTLGHTVEVINAGSINVFRNGVPCSGAAATSTPNMTGWTEGSFRLFATTIGTTGVVENFSYGLRLPAFWCGAALSQAEAADFYTSLNKLLAVIGTEPLQTPTQAEIVAKITPNNPTNGSTVTYSIAPVSGTGITLGTMTIDQIGDLTDSDFSTAFKTALATAVSGSSDIAFDGNRTLTFSQGFTGLTFARTVSSTPANGKMHGLQLGDGSFTRTLTPKVAVSCGTPAISTPTGMLRGVNFSGAEFGYPFYDTTGADLDYYLNKGFNIIRLPHLWDRLQPTVFGDLDIVGDGTGAAEKYKFMVDHITAAGAYVVIDPHNYGGRGVGGIAYKISALQLPVSALVDYYEKLADYLGDNDHIIYLLMNEPSGGISQDEWWNCAKATTDAIRLKGYKTLIHVPGTDFTSAARWTTDGNSTYAGRFKDPFNNFVFEVHNYFDSAGSGATGVCAVGSGSRLNAITTWAAANSVSLALGEFACGDWNQDGQAQCQTEIEAAIGEMESNPAVWKMWTVWGGGHWWSDTYQFRLEPVPPATADTALMTYYEGLLP